VGGERDRKLKSDIKCVQFVMAVCACLGIFFLNVTSVLFILCFFVCVKESVLCVPALCTILSFWQKFEDVACVGI